MNALKMAIYWSDMAKFNKTLARVEKVPQKVVNKAASKGTTVVRKAIRGKVPVRSGKLKRGIIRNGERRRTRGKKVYDLMFDPAMNDIFQKPIKNPGEAGGKNKKGYYPASMECGFLTRANKGGGLRYVARRTGIGLKRFEGLHFMRDAAEESSIAAKRTMIQTVTSELEKEWLK